MPTSQPQQDNNALNEEWREVYNECFYKGIINKEKIAAILHKSNMVDFKILDKEQENG
jgi:hypothetical protein